MRALHGVVIVSAAIAGLGQAQAADLRVGRSGGVTGTYGAHGTYVAAVRAGQYVISDYEPGVATRAYWAAPWQNRHYFPFTGKKPKVGRHENLSAKRPALKPAESFYREWSTVSLYPPGAVMPPPDNNQPLVVNETTVNSPSLK
jgi:hypothetical protein